MKPSSPLKLLSLSIAAYPGAFPASTLSVEIIPRAGSRLLSGALPLLLFLLPGYLPRGRDARPPPRHARPLRVLAGHVSHWISRLAPTTPAAAPYVTLMTEPAPQRRHAVREVFNGLRWLVRAGAPWRMLPTALPPWAAVYQQTQRWLRAGVFEALVPD